MKFAEHLSAHITPEWRKQYIQYEEMKAMLYAAVEQAPSPEESEESVVQRYFAKFDEKFFLFSEKELAKINTFFSEKLAEATRKFANLKNELYYLNEESEFAQGTMARFRKGKIFSRDKESKMAVSRHRKIRDLKVAFSEFYLSLILLQNYQSLNYTGFRKIFKKHDKLLGTDRGANWKQINVDTAHFFINKDIDRLIQQTEALFTQELESGNRQKAMKRLRVPPLNDQQSPWTTFRVGFFAGIFCVLCITIILTATFIGTGDDDWRPALRLFRGTFLIILDTFLIALNVYGWRAAGVNHVLIFELDPRNHLSHQHLMELAGIFAVLWSLCVLAYFYYNSLNIPSYASPLALVCIMMLFLFNPTKTMQHEARFWLIKILWHIVTAPFHYVGFADFWLADQLNSVVLVLLDLQYLVCFYAFEVDWLPSPKSDVCMSNSYGIRPLVASLPAWFRFAQCLRRYRDTKKAYPHLVNAGKYSTTFFVVIFSALHSTISESTSSPYFYLWIISAVISSFYTYTWDVRMDWGLFEQNAGENRFLREEIVYSSKGYYYFAIVEDFILRFAWTLSVSVGEGKQIESDILLSVLGPLEVFRRFVWNYFRLENEHLNNCGQFRAVRDISVAPKDSSDQDILEKMMDDDDGILNRRKDKKKPYKSKHKEAKVWIDLEEEEDPRTSRYGGGV